MTPNPPAGPVFGAPAPTKSAQEQLNVPSILLLLAGALGGVWFLMSIGQSLMMNPDDIAKALDDMPDPNARRMMEPFLKMATGPARFAWPVVGLGANAFIIFGAVMMRQLKGWPIALIAAVFATLPCCFNGCCCIFTMPAGIWCLTLLLKDDIKQQFS